MTTQDFNDIEALRRQCARIRQLATDALQGAIQRRETVLAEVRQEEQRLAHVTLERRLAEESLAGMREQVEHLSRELEQLTAELGLGPTTTPAAGPGPAAEPTALPSHSFGEPGPPTWGFREPLSPAASPSEPTPPSRPAEPRPSWAAEPEPAAPTWSAAERVAWTPAEPGQPAAPAWPPPAEPGQPAEPAAPAWPSPPPAPVWSEPLSRPAAGAASPTVPQQAPLAVDPPPVAMEPAPVAAEPAPPLAEAAPPPGPAVGAPVLEPGPLVIEPAPPVIQPASPRIEPSPAVAESLPPAWASGREPANAVPPAEAAVPGGANAGRPAQAAGPEPANAGPPGFAPSARSVAAPGAPAVPVPEPSFVPAPAAALVPVPALMTQPPALAEVFVTPLTDALRATAVVPSAEPLPASRARGVADQLADLVPASLRLRHAVTAFLSVLLVGLAMLLTPLPQLFGWELFAVQSGSMEPAIHVGGIVAVHPVPADQLKVGDVITFVDQNRPDAFVTHRIVELSFNNGQASAKTKGDANDAADAWTVPTNRAVGRVDLALPYLGYLTVWLSSPLAKLAILGLAVLGLALPSVQRRQGQTGTAALSSTTQAQVPAAFGLAMPPVIAGAAASASPSAAPAPVAPVVPSEPVVPSAPVVPSEPAAAPVAPGSSFDELEQEIRRMLGTAEQRPAA